MSRDGLEAAFEHVASKVVNGGRLVAAQQLRGGSSATVYRLEVADGAEHRAVVLRQHRSLKFKGDADDVTPKEYQVLRLLHRLGLRVPKPLLIDMTGELADPYIVLDWVDGDAEVHGDGLAAALKQMAEFLVELHRCDVDQFVDIGPDVLSDARVAMLDYLPNSDLGLALAHLLRDDQVALVSNPLVLIHGDYWPGNILWQDGNLAAVIDWEDCQRGDPLADLATARVELLCQYGNDASETFTRHYLAQCAQAGVQLSPASLPLWESFVSATALATMHLWDISAEEEAQRRAATSGFFEAAAIALLDEFG